MLDFIKEKQDVWQILQLTDKPVVLYTIIVNLISVYS